LEDHRPRFRPLRANKPTLAVVLSLAVVISMFGGAFYIFAFYLR